MSDSMWSHYSVWNQGKLDQLFLSCGLAVTCKIKLHNFNYFCQVIYSVDRSISDPKNKFLGLAYTNCVEVIMIMIIINNKLLIIWFDSSLFCLSSSELGWRTVLACSLSVQFAVWTTASQWRRAVLQYDVMHCVLWLAVTVACALALF